MPSLRIHPFHPHPDFIPDSKGLVSPLSHKTIFSPMILIIIVVQAGHSHQTFYKNRVEDSTYGSSESVTGRN
jgi:hypothetical protein